MAKAEIIRSSFTNHKTTNAPIKLFLFYHPGAKRLHFSVGSRWETYKSFSNISHAEAYFEASI